MNRRQEKRMKEEISRINAQMRAASEAEARDQERYARILSIDTETERFGKRADRHQLRASQVRINHLLAEREKIDIKLAAYYNASSEQNPDKNYVKDFDKAEHKARVEAKESLAKDKHTLYSERHAVGDVLLKHDKLSNNYIELSGKLARVKKRLNSGGKITKAAKEQLLDERARLKAERKKVKKKLDKKTDKLMVKAKAAKASRREQRNAIIILAVLIAAGVLCYVYRNELLVYVQSLISGFMGGASV